MLETPEVADLLEVSAPEACLLRQQFRGHGLLRLLQTTLRPARCHMTVGHQKSRNTPEKERFGEHLFASQKLVLLPPNLNGLVYIGFPMCFITLQLVLTESQNAFPPKEGRQPNPSPDNTQYHTAVAKNALV